MYLVDNLVEFQKMTHINFSKGLVYGVFAALLFACVGGISSFLSDEIPVSQILLIQNGFAFLLLLLFSQKSTFAWDSVSQNKGLYLFRSCAGVLSTFAFTSSLKDLDLVDATLLNMTAPFFLPLIGFAWLNEKIKWTIWPILCLGFYGASLIYPPSKGIFQMGGMLALASGFLTALSLSSLRRLHQKNEPCLRIAMLMLLFGIVLNGSLSLAYWHRLSPWEWALAISGGVFMGINQLFLTKAIRILPLSFLAPIAYAVFPFSALINGIIYAEPIEVTTLIGAFLICLSGVLTRRIHSQIRSFQD